MSMTVLDLITEAATLFGAIAQGETLNASEEAQGLSFLNQLIDRWNVEGLCIYTLRDVLLNLTSGKASYTIGPGAGDFNQARPARIKDANVISGYFSFDVQLITADQYSDIREKAEQAQAPRQLYCDYAYPIASLKLWPVPVSACQLELFAWQALSSFADLTTVVDLPPAYTEALKFNLALRMGPAFYAPADRLQAIAVTAADDKAALQRFNMETLGIAPPPPAAPPQPSPQ